MDANFVVLLGSLVLLVIAFFTAYLCKNAIVRILMVLVILGVLFIMLPVAVVPEKVDAQINSWTAMEPTPTLVPTIDLTQYENMTESEYQELLNQLEQDK